MSFVSRCASAVFLLVRATTFLSLILLTACASGGMSLTMNSFHDIPVGASVEEVIATAGTPHAIHRKSDGTVEYEYIERFKTGARNVNERHYYILIKEGQVVSKRVEQSSPLPYGFDSYEMQTTQNGSERDF